jgi:hypothetical protein
MVESADSVRMIEATDRIAPKLTLAITPTTRAGRK